MAALPHHNVGPSSKENVEMSDKSLNDERLVFSPKEERRLRRKFDFFILPPLTFM